MQEPIEPTDDLLLAELKQLRPRSPGKSKMELWYAAGSIAAQRRARRWHAAAIVSFVGLAVFTLLRPIPQPTTKFVDRVVYVQPPPERSTPLPSFTGAIENRRQYQEALQDKWNIDSVCSQVSAKPPMRVWMSDSDLEKTGGL